MKYKALIIGSGDNNEANEILKKNGFEVEQFIKEIDDSTILKEYPNLILLEYKSLISNELIKNIRYQNFRVPIMTIFSNYNEIDIVVSLELGADDFVIKPMDPRVFIAKVKSLLRRSSIENQEDNYRQILRVRDIIIVPDSHKLIRNEKEIYLTPQEFKLLCLFARNKGELLSRTEIFKELGYNNVTTSDSRLVDTYVSKLRNKLDLKKEIKTYRNVGYMFKEFEVD